MSEHWNGQIKQKHIDQDWFGHSLLSRGFYTYHIRTSMPQLFHSDHLQCVNACKVFPSLSNNELDHNVTWWLVNSHRLALFLTTVGGNLARLSNSFKSVSICCLTSLDCNFFDTSSYKSHFIDNLSLLELNGKLLWEHACCQPVRIIVPIQSW